MSAQSGIEQILARFIAEEIAYDRDEPQIGRDEPLLDGLLDSADILRLVVFIEEQFHVQVADHELVPENFASIGRVATLVAQKTP
jgi:acyl carrier protein